MKRYQIREMATLLDISPSALRNFEEKGLLFPHRTTSGGYRQFEPVDLNLLFRIRGFTRCGFSLEKTAELMHDMDIDRVSDALEEQSAEIEKEMQLLALKSRYMRHRAAHLRRAAVMTEPWVIEPSPAMYVLPFRTWEQILDGDGRGSEIRRWAALKPFTESLYMVPKAGMEDGTLTSICGACIEKEYGDALGIREEGHVRLIAAREMCAYTLSCVTTCRTEQVDLAGEQGKESMKELLASLASAGYAPDGDAYGTTLHTQVDYAEYQHVSEIWLPLRKI